MSRLGLEKFKPAHGAGVVAALITARSIMPLGEGVVPYSSKQMEQCWSSLLRIPRPTLGRRARNLEAMVGWVRSVGMEVRSRWLVKEVNL